MSFIIMLGFIWINRIAKSPLFLAIAYGLIGAGFALFSTQHIPFSLMRFGIDLITSFVFFWLLAKIDEHIVWWLLLAVLGLLVVPL